METKVSEIADGIFRLSTFVPDIAPPAGFTFNQFLVLGDEPLMFHTGLRKMFPLNRAALSRILPPERLRWIAFGHFESDECGAMNEWLAIAPRAWARIGRHVTVPDGPGDRFAAASLRTT
jgi:flavorubredoxin